MNGNATVYAPGGVLIAMPKIELIALCRKHGAELDTLPTNDGTGKPLEGATLLWAMAGRESSFGQNMRPRHEPAYDTGGIYAKQPQQAAALLKYGPPAACSYGPLQIMACNAPHFTPYELEGDVETALIASADRLENWVIAHQNARTIAQICECWNDGHIISGKTIPAEVASYIADVTRYYAAGIPA